MKGAYDGLTLAALIKKRRADLRLSMGSMGDAGGFTKQYVNALEKGRSCNPRATHVALIAFALNLDVGVVLKSALRSNGLTDDG